MTQNSDRESKIQSYELQVINLNVAVIFAEVKRAFAIFLAERFRLVDFSVLWKLAVRLKIPRLVSSVFDDDIGFVVLEIAQREQDNIALVDPNLQFLCKDVSVIDRYRSG